MKMGGSKGGIYPPFASAERLRSAESKSGDVFLLFFIFFVQRA